MDSITHIAVGACIGEAFFEKGFGKKAMFWGALAQSIPDIDFVAGAWMDTSAELLAHRGFTHSLLFTLFVVPLFSLTASRFHPKEGIPLFRWILFFAIEVLLHLFLDGFNNYGIGWLEPFSHERFSFNAIYVADPFFSIWPGIALLVLLLLHRFHGSRSFWWRFGLFLPFIYLSYCTINKYAIDREVRKIFNRQHIPHQHYFTTPSPLNNWLWFVVAGNDSGFHVGFRSLFDQSPEMDFSYFPRNNSLLKPIADHEDLQHLIRFSKGFYTVEQHGDTLVFNDLRFGQIIGWHDPKEQFVFHYYLQHPTDNDLVVQRGRFAGWNQEVVLSLWKRIKGN
jgi:inner membrane protein